ncbi:hypothetical protein RI054_37g141200 [Pseudoscourfieldia marina]
MNIIVNKYRSSDDAKTKKFCLSLAKHAPEGAWYRGLKAEQMAVALAHRSTPRAMETKFALRQTWASGGRAAESAYLLYTGLKWDYDQHRRRHGALAPPIFEDGEACFLNTKLSLAAHPARVLGASMKDLRKDCPELPEDVSAGGRAPAW